MWSINLVLHFLYLGIDISLISHVLKALINGVNIISWKVLLISLENRNNLFQYKNVNLDANFLRKCLLLLHPLSQRLRSVKDDPERSVKGRRWSWQQNPLLGLFKFHIYTIFTYLHDRGRTIQMISLIFSTRFICCLSSKWEVNYF